MRPPPIPPGWLADYRDAVARCEQVGLLVMVVPAHLRLLLDAYDAVARATAKAKKETS